MRDPEEGPLFEVPRTGNREGNLQVAGLGYLVGTGVSAVEAAWEGGKRIVDLTPKGKLSLTAAGLGLFSLLLPWVMFTGSKGFATAFSWESPLQLLASLVSPPTSSASTDPAILAWEREAAVGTGLWIIGTIVFALGCLLLIAQAFASIRWAGFQVMAGSVISLVGILSFSTSFTTYADVTISIGPTFGLLLAFIASLVALLPFFRTAGADRWFRVPPVASDPVGFTRALESLHSPRFVYAAPFPPPAAAVPGAPSGPSPPSSIVAANLTRRFCPECGHWYLDGEEVCPRDRTPLKPVRADVSG